MQVQAGLDIQDHKVYKVFRVLLARKVYKVLLAHRD